MSAIIQERTLEYDTQVYAYNLTTATTAAFGVLTVLTALSGGAAFGLYLLLTSASLAGRCFLEVQIDGSNLVNKTGHTALRLANHRWSPDLLRLGNISILKAPLLDLSTYAKLLCD